jgi:hypothetical protein
VIDVEKAVMEMVEGSGYVLVPGAFDPRPALSAVTPVVDDWVARGGPTVDGGYKPDVMLLTDVQRLMITPWVREVGRVLLGCQPGFGSLIVNSVPPGSPGMGAHVDSPYAQMTDAELAEERPCLCLQMIWYLEDVAEDFAPTAVVPGSQLRRARPGRDFWDQAVPVLVKAGTLFLSHGALWHATMPNRTSRYRPAIISKYFPAWCRPPWNPFCHLPPGILPEMVDLLYPAGTGQPFMTPRVE